MILKSIEVKQGKIASGRLYLESPRACFEPLAHTARQLAESDVDGRLGHVRAHCLARHDIRRAGR